MKQIANHARHVVFPLILFFAACTTTGADGSNMGKTVTTQPGTTAPNVITLLLPYLEGHPEALEGNPSTSLTINRSGNAFVADIQLAGFLDDSVSGEEIKARIEPASAGGWTLVEVSRTPICARGVSADGLCT